MSSIAMSSMKRFVQHGRPVLLRGHPGTGKTYQVNKIGKELGWMVETVIVHHHDPTDFGGMPVGVNKDVELKPMPWARRLLQHKGPAVLFLDELDKANPPTQAACLRLIHERVLGDVPLGSEVRIIAAANFPDEGGWELTPPLANRFAHIAWEPTVEECARAVGDVAVEEAASSPDPMYRRAVSDFGGLVGAAIRKFAWSLTPPKDLVQANGAWASPRTMTAVIHALAVAQVEQISKAERNHDVFSLVGEGVGSELLTWLDQQDLPDAESLLANPSTLGEKWPPRTDLQFAILRSVVLAVTSDPTAKRWNAAAELCGIAATLGGEDVAIPPLRDLKKLVQGDSSLQSKIRYPDSLATLLPVIEEAGL